MPYWELDWTAEVTRALDLDVTGGEQDCDLTVWRRMINMRVVNVVQPDVCWIGAICRTLRVAEMAGAAGLPVTPLSANLPLAFLFTLHLMGALPNAGPYDGYYPWQEGIYDPVLVVTDGMVSIPDGPGWGIEVRQDWITSANHQVSDAG